jgi:cell division transport system permease protein
MSKKDTKLSKRQLRSSYITSIISISLVLFVVGLAGLLLLNARKISRHVKENIGFSVFLHDGVKEVDMIRLQKKLDASEFVKATEYITKERAAEELKADLGEDFVSFLGYIPLLPSIEVRLLADYANIDSIARIEKMLMAYPEIEEVSYQKSLVEIVNKNIRKISLVLMAFCGMLFLISLSLINNTIRLSVYARRFIIKTMELVGATRSFVRKPFLIKSFGHALYSIIIAFILLGGVIWLINQQLPELAILYDIDTIAILFCGLFILGVTMVWLSTWFAVSRYLRMRSSELYF